MTDIRNDEIRMTNGPGEGARGGLAFGRGGKPHANGARGEDGASIQASNPAVAGQAFEILSRYAGSATGRDGGAGRTGRRSNPSTAGEVSDQLNNHQIP